MEEYYTRCESGTLPALSFVDPSFAGEGEGVSGDEHPHGDIRTGQAFMADVVNAFIESPQYRRGALFIVYDEWGGFFDHVPPPRVPDQRNSRRLRDDFGFMGFRVPAVGVSPYLRGGETDHSIHGFESILKMIEYRFGLEPLTRRTRYARNIARSFDFESKRQIGNPSLPDPPNVVSQACGSPDTSGGPPDFPGGIPDLLPKSGAGAAPAARPKEHDMKALLDSGYLERLGFDYRPATAESTFREPSKVESALRSRK